MALKLKLDNVVKISPDFVDLMRSFYENWARQNTRLIHIGSTDPDGEYGGYTMTARRLMPIVRGQSPSLRDGLEYEITRFRGLKFASFDVYEGPEPFNARRRGNPQTIRWMVGRTRHIQATYWNMRQWDERAGKFIGDVAGELGGYNIYIPETIAVKPALADLHMIPQRNLYSIFRHYHHKIINVGADRATRNPLTYETDNCWGDYQLPMNSLLTVPDLPELFRQLYRHLCTFGYLPPNTDLDFDTNTPEA